MHLTTFGTTTEKRTLPLAVIGATGASPAAVRRTGKLRVYIQGNIHGGEVEGKESAQMLLRDLAAGRHDDWLQSMVFLIAPIYNADGNERFALNNRGPQYGPIGGQGQRPNAQGLDLNRDHMKLDSPEARAVVKLMTDYDPQVALDLHTTNGTRHAYHLTYSPPLHPGDRSGHRRSAAQGVVPVRHQARCATSTAGTTSYYGNLEAARQRPSRRRAAPLGDVRPSPALQQQLHRPAQPLRAPQRGVRLSHLPGPHPRDQPLRRRGADVRERQRRPDSQGGGGRRHATADRH